MIQPLWTTDTSSQIFKDSIAIRHDIFIEEQAYPPGSDIDDLEEHTEHLVLYEGKRALATVRIYNTENHTYRIERVAVRSEARERGLGTKLMELAEAKIIELGGTRITLKSEDTAIEFYEKFDYEVVGDEIMEYGLPHQQMEKTIETGDD